VLRQWPSSSFRPEELRALPDCWLAIRVGPKKVGWIGEGGSSDSSVSRWPPVDSDKTGRCRLSDWLRLSLVSPGLSAPPCLLNPRATRWLKSGDSVLCWLCSNKQTGCLWLLLDGGSVQATSRCLCCLTSAFIWVAQTGKRQMELYLADPAAAGRVALSGGLNVRLHTDSHTFLHLALLSTSIRPVFRQVPKRQRHSY
jgi:hypothetical protein